MRLMHTSSLLGCGVEPQQNQIGLKGHARDIPEHPIQISFEFYSKFMLTDSGTLLRDLTHQCNPNWKH